MTNNTTVGRLRKQLRELAVQGLFDATIDDAKNGDTQAARAYIRAAADLMHAGKPLPQQFHSFIASVLLALSQGKNPMKLSHRPKLPKGRAINIAYAVHCLCEQKVSRREALDLVSKMVRDRHQRSIPVEHGAVAKITPSQVGKIYDAHKRNFFQATTASISSTSTRIPSPAISVIDNFLRMPLHQPQAKRSAANAKKSNR